MLKNNIKTVLKARKTSVLRLSEIIGLTYASTHSLANREDLSDTKIGTLVKTADALGVDVNTLYTVVQ